MREDLLALDEDSLAALANRGIVKRAAREVEGGSGPSVSEDADTVTGTFADGTTVVLAPNLTLAQGTCSCPASGVCRHRVMVVIAYRAGGERTLEVWSPGEFDDDAIVSAVGARLIAIARRTRRGGYRARVRRPSAADAVATVELPSCTVRFLVPHEIGYARVDAAAGTRDDAIALAVWAFQAADAQAPDVATVDLMVGGETLAVADRVSGVEEVLPYLAELLADGVTHAGPALGPSAAHARRVLDSRNLRWPVDALDEVTDLLDGYRDRNAHYSALSTASAVAELVARHRCVTAGGASPRSDVLGTEEAAETRLRLLRLTGFGARVTGDATSRTVEVYLAHVEAGVVLTLRRLVQATPDADPPTAVEVGRRKVGGARLSVLAGGNVVSESAVRSANRLVRVTESRLATTTVTPSAGAWQDLPDGLLVTDLDAEAARIAGLAPAVIRPRIVAESLRAVEIVEVESVGWLPGEQRLVGTLRTPGGRASLSLPYSAAAPGAVDATAEALGADPRFVAGHLRRHGGGLVVEPTALVVGNQVVVPAFAEPHSAQVDAATPADGDAVTRAVREALSVSAEVVHRGWRHLPPSWAVRAEQSAQRLTGLSLEHAGSCLRDLARAVRRGGTELDLLDNWADTHLRLLVTAEQL